MSELCSFKCLKLYSLNFGLNIFISQIDFYIYNNYKHYKRIRTKARAYLVHLLRQYILYYIHDIEYFEHEVVAK